jgi:hypothetical protein
MGEACEHEVDPMPTGYHVDQIPISGRLPAELESIVPCKKCGAPIQRPRFDGVISDNRLLAKMGLPPEPAGPR